MIQLSEPNYAANMIATLAGLPPFLRRPMLNSRVSEFPHLSKEEQTEIIINALDASPTLPFPTFATLLQTWLEILAEIPPEQRRNLLEAYATEILLHPEKLIKLHLDGIVGVFMALDPAQQNAILDTLRTILNSMDDNDKNRLMLLMPDSAKTMLNV